MRAIAAYQHLTETREVERSVWDDATHQFVKRRVQVATPRYDEHGKPVVKLLDANITVHPEDTIRYHWGGCRFTSLHRAKNAIRRHFGIESRRLLHWVETRA